MRCRRRRPCSYTVSKSFLYLFLTERVRIVQAVKIPRLKSRSYMAMIVALTIPCTAILILMIFGASSTSSLFHSALLRAVG